MWEKAKLCERIEETTYILNEVYVVSSEPCGSLPKQPSVGISAKLEVLRVCRVRSIGVGGVH